MSDDVSEKAYLDSIESSAKELVDEIRCGNLSRSDLDTAISEAANSSWWTIHYYAARHVLLHSKNEDAMIDALGNEHTFDSMGMLYCLAATFAYEADLREAFDEFDTEEINDDEEE